jgi:hypothetical protein
MLKELRELKTIISKLFGTSDLPARSDSQKKQSLKLLKLKECEAKTVKSTTKASYEF